MAHGILREKVKQAGLSRQIRVDSAGTHALTGQRPDPRARGVAMAHGINISRIKARQLLPEDFQRFDYVLGMDSANLEFMQGLCPEGCLIKVRKVCGAGPEANDVPDPYFGNPAGFERIYDILDRALSEFLEELEAHLLNKG